MTDQELIEQLAERLYDFYLETYDLARYPRATLNRIAAKTLAREVLRQMKWSQWTGRLIGVDQTMSCGYSRERLLKSWNEQVADGQHPASNFDLHLAPDGWNPE